MRLTPHEEQEVDRLTAALIESGRGEYVHVWDLDDIQLDGNFATTDLLRFVTGIHALLAARQAATAGPARVNP